MAPKIDRRAFLSGLMALGAAVTLPHNPSNAQIDDAWVALERDPWFFEVDNYGTIVEPGIAEPKIRADVFEGVSVEWVKNPKDLILELESTEPLRWRFEEIARGELDEVEWALDEDNSLRMKIEDEEDQDWRARLSEELLAPAKRSELERRREILASDKDEPWRPLIQAVDSDMELARMKEIIVKWLAEPVDWYEMDWFPERWCGQGAALSFFNETWDVNRELGVRIVEGEHPGSTYYAAELRVPVEDANEAAARLELPFRFRRADP
jgi:hypothetical protein